MVQKVLEKIMPDNFPNIIKCVKRQIQEGQRSSNMKNCKKKITKKEIPRHIILKLLKTKDKQKILKESEE